MEFPGAYIWRCRSALLRGVIFTPILMFVVPVVGLLLNYVNRTVGWVILGVFLGILLLDIVITIITIARLSHQFKRLAELGAMVREARDALGSAVTEKTLDAAEAIDDLDLDEKLLKAQESAEESYTALLNKSNFFKRRFLSASPDMTSEQYEKGAGRVPHHDGGAQKAGARSARRATSTNTRRP